MRAHPSGFTADRAFVRAGHLAMRAITHVLLWPAMESDDQLHGPPDSRVMSPLVPVDDERESTMHAADPRHEIT